MTTMPQHDAGLFDAAAELSSKALTLLIRQRGKWEAGVESAEVLLALYYAGLGRHQLAQDAAETFAQAQVKDGPSAGSWDAADDVTAYGVMVAAAYPGVFNAGQMAKAAEFLLGSYGNTAIKYSWSDEVGTTLLGLRALAIARNPRLNEIAGKSLLWLTNFDDGFGMLINERYSAEFVAAVQEIEEIGDVLGEPDIKVKVREHAELMTNALLRSCAEQLDQEKILWNNDPRANGITLEAMARALVRSAAPAAQRNIISWFKARQGADGAFGTFLATARIVQGLARVQYWLSRQRGLDHEAARARVAQAHRGVSEGIPLALLWKPMRLHHDTERQARVVIVPDPIWRSLLWIVWTAIPAIIALLVWLFGDILKQAILSK